MPQGVPDHPVNLEGEPLEIGDHTVRPGNTLVRVADGKPVFEVKDTQQGGGDGWPDGVFMQRATKQGSITFLTAGKLKEFLDSREYRV